jgi:hypothetical protein
LILDLNDDGPKLELRDDDDDGKEKKQRLLV